MRRNVRRLAIVGLAAALLLATRAVAVEVSGVRLSARIQSGGADLVLHRASLFRWMRFLKVYVAALYLAPGADPERVLEPDVARRLEIEYFRGFSAEQFAESARQLVRRNVGDTSYERLEPRVEALCALFRDVEAGDRYALTYVPRRGTELALNGAPLGVVEGGPAAGAIFSIWLGKSPMDEGLRDTLLGRK